MYMQSVILSSPYSHMICKCTQQGATPLMAAVHQDQLEAARVLIRECNCNTNARALVSCSVHLSCCVSTPAYICVYECADLLILYHVHFMVVKLRMFSRLAQ